VDLVGSKIVCRSDHTFLDSVETVVSPRLLNCIDFFSAHICRHYHCSWAGGLTFQRIRAAVIGWLCTALSIICLRPGPRQKWEGDVGGRCRKVACSVAILACHKFTASPYGEPGARSLWPDSAWALYDRICCRHNVGFCCPNWQRFMV
jgi:hypothetical protein